MSAAALFVVLVWGAFVAYGVKASVDTYRLYKAGFRGGAREYDMAAAARYFRDIAAGRQALPDRAWSPPLRTAAPRGPCVRRTKHTSAR